MAGYLGIGGIGEERDPLAGIKALLGGFVPEQWRGGTTVPPSTGAGMTPLPVNPEAIRTFTERVNPPGQLTGNIGNLPPGDFLRMLYNPNVAAPTPAPTITPGVSPPVSPADMAVAGATKMAGQYGGGRMPWDFFLRNPAVSGGTLGLEGPEWAGKKSLTGEALQPGQTFTSFEATKPPNMMDMIGSLIQDYSTRLSGLANMPTSGRTAEETIQQSRQKNLFKAYTEGFGSIMDKILAGAKAPSEIAKNLAEAGKVQIAPDVFVGPMGEKGTFMIPPYGQPRQIAGGAPQEKMTPLEATEKKINEMEVAVWGDIYKNEITPEGKALALGKINEALGRARGAKPQTTQQKVTQKDYTAWAKKQGYTDTQIKAELQTLISRGSVY